MKAIFYNPMSGQITKAIEGPDQIIEINKGPNEEYIEGEIFGAINDYKIIDKVLTKKASFNLTVSGRTISNIPVGTKVQVNLQGTVEVDDGSLSLDAQYNDEVLLVFMHPDYLHTTLRVAV